MVGVVELIECIGPPAVGNSVHGIFALLYAPPGIACNSPRVTVLIGKDGGYRKGRKHLTAAVQFIDKAPEAIIVSLDCCSDGRVVVGISLYHSVACKIYLKVLEACFLQTLRNGMKKGVGSRMSRIETEGAIILIRLSVDPNAGIATRPPGT